MKYPIINEDERIRKLYPPAGRVSMVLDTDTYNEIDDQFAVVYSLLSKEKFDVEALYAAPFFIKERSDGPGDGMEKSYDEILRLLERMNVRPDNFVFKGSRSFLPDSETPCESPAARDLVKKALASEDDSPLYVVAIGAITNVASAILMNPEIINKIVVVWLGGNPLYWPHTREFNLMQDIHSSRIMFDCGVPLVHIPCLGVTTHLHTTVPEMELYLAGKGAIGEYLLQIFKEYNVDHYCCSKVIWDIAPVAWLVNSSWVPTELDHSPVLTDQMTWSVDRNRHFIRTANMVDRDSIFRDMFTKLAKFAK